MAQNVLVTLLLTNFTFDFVCVSLPDMYGVIIKLKENVLLIQYLFNFLMIHHSTDFH